MNSPVLTARIFAKNDETFVKCRQVFADADIPILIEREDNLQFKVGNSGPKLEMYQPSAWPNKSEFNFWTGQEFQVISLPNEWLHGVYIRADIRD